MEEAREVAGATGSEVVVPDPDTVRRDQKHLAEVNIVAHHLVLALCDKLDQLVAKNRSHRELFSNIYPIIVEVAKQVAPGLSSNIAGDMNVAMDSDTMTDIDSKATDVVSL